MPRVPVRADTYTGMKRLSSFGFVPPSGQGSVEKRAKPSETFRRDQQQPPRAISIGAATAATAISRIAIFANNELRVRVYRRYGRVATVRGPVRQLCGSTPFACARCQESALAL